MKKTKTILLVVGGLVILGVGGMLYRFRYFTSSEKAQTPIEAQEMNQYFEKKSEKLMKEKYYGAQIALYEGMRKQYPDSVDLKKKLAEAYQNAGREEEAKKLLGEIQQADQK